MVRLCKIYKDFKSIPEIIVKKKRAKKTNLKLNLFFANNKWKVSKKC